MTESRSIIDSHLTALGHRLGEPLGLNEDGLCLMEASDGTECLIAALPGSSDAVLSSPLLSLPEGGASPAFYESLLSLNHDLVRGPGAALAMEQDGRLLMLHQRLGHGGSDYDGFVGLLDGFLALREALFVRVSVPSGSADRGEGLSGEPVPESVIRA